MGDIFSSLESMGFGGLKNIKIYDEDNEGKKTKQQEQKKEEKVNEADFLFDKKIQCPVCDKEFKTKTVKTGKARLLGSDSDLRPKYKGIDPIKYDAIVCPGCGYAALSRYFSYMTTAQAKLIKDNVTANFKGVNDNVSIFTYDEAINRHKLALLNTIVKKSKNSERAYTCLKIAWLYRGKTESLTPETPDYEKLKKDCIANEQQFMQNAFEGFVASQAKEDFPICGMDDATFTYLLADVARRCNKIDIASKLLSNIIVSRTANAKIKEKARDLRDQIKLEKK